MDESTIWMTAVQMLEVYGDDAEIEAVILACVRTGQSDTAGHRHWIAVADAIAVIAQLKVAAEVQRR